MKNQKMTVGGLSVGQIGAVAAGNALEFYDFLTFSFFATQIGNVFFPLENENSRLLLALATFGVGFLMRPLGGFLIGRMGDRRGRKPAMLFSFGLMGASITGLALTPSYASIGVAAPVLIVLFRLLQGFALGGEVGPSSAFLMEAAPPARRGFYVSLQFSTQWLATLLAGVVGLVLASKLTPDALTQWGWRVAFLIGVLVVPFGLIVRRYLPETLGQREETAVAAHFPWGVVVRGLFMLAAGTIATYTLNYLTTFSTHTLGLPARVAFGVTAICGLCGVIFTVIGGYLADRLGRKPVMLTMVSLLMLAVIPCFLAMVNLKTGTALLGAAMVMAILLALSLPAMFVSLMENLPAATRSGGIGTLYALAISIFGGTAQFVVAALITVTGSPLMPAWYMAGALFLGLIALAGMRETAPVKVG
jgi:MHS family citrate/tricarballylate:H+ symporter-like MFS transporter